MIRPAVPLLAVLLVTSCAGTRPDPWYDRFQAAARLPGGERVVAMDQLTGEAATATDRCLARVAAAEAGGAAGRWQELLAAPECATHHDRALFELMVVNRHRPLVAVARLNRLLADHHRGYWARRAVEWAWQERSAFLPPEELAALLVDRYEELADTDLGGHLLYYAAAAWLGGQLPRELSPEAWLALYHLLLLVDHHSSSPLWDDGLWLAADLLAALGRTGDESRLLEGALVPHPGRGHDALADRFTARVRMRLARLYERQGRYQEALYQLDLVLRHHDRPSLYDDSLWQTARIHATLGNQDQEREALEALLTTCPHSRHTQSARKRLR